MRGPLPRQAAAVPGGVTRGQGEGGSPTGSGGRDPGAEVVPSAFWGETSDFPPGLVASRGNASVAAGAEGVDLPPVLSRLREPSWWGADVRLLDLLVEVYQVVGERSREALRALLPPRSGESQEEAPETPPTSLEPEARGGEGYEHTEPSLPPPTAQPQQVSEAARPLPLAFPGLEEVADGLRSRRRR